MVRILAPACPDCHRKFPQPALSVKVLARNVSLNAACTNCGRPMKDLNVCTLDGEPAFLCSDCLAGLTK